MARVEYIRCDRCGSKYTDEERQRRVITSLRGQQPLVLTTSDVPDPNSPNNVGGAGDKRFDLCGVCRAALLGFLRNEKVEPTVVSHELLQTDTHFLVK